MSSKSAALFEAVEVRRSVYALTSDLPISHEAVNTIVENAVKHHPTSFNNQATRAIILYGEENQKLWQITSDALKAVVPADQFAATEAKIQSFAAGHGSIVWFIDRTDIQALENAFPAYAPNFAPWGQQSVGIAQFIVWSALATEGVGASLQHYGELIKDKVRAEFKVPDTWDIVSQQPFGAISPAWKNPERTFKPSADTVKVYGA